MIHYSSLTFGSCMWPHQFLTRLLLYKLRPWNWVFPLLVPVQRYGCTANWSEEEVTVTCSDQERVRGDAVYNSWLISSDKYNFPSWKVPGPAVKGAPKFSVCRVLLDSAGSMTSDCWVCRVLPDSAGSMTSDCWVCRLLLDSGESMTSDYSVCGLLTVLRLCRY